MKERQAFGQPIGSFQNSRFAMAELATELEMGQAFVDRCVARTRQRQSSTAESRHGQVVDHRAPEAGQRPVPPAHGGYGYMDEYEISRAWRDGRVQTIYGGTTEIMKEIVGRRLGL